MVFLLISAWHLHPSTRQQECLPTLTKRMPMCLERINPEITSRPPLMNRRMDVPTHPKTIATTVASGWRRGSLTGCIALASLGAVRRRLGAIPDEHLVGVAWMTSLLPRSSWLLHLSQISTQKASFTQLPVPNNDPISSFKFVVELVFEGASQPFNQAPAFTAKSIVALTFKQSSLTLFGNSHSQSQLIVNFCAQSLANEQDIKAGMNSIQYSSSILWQMNKMCGASQRWQTFDTELHPISTMIISAGWLSTQFLREHNVLQILLLPSKPLQPVKFKLIVKSASDALRFVGARTVPTISSIEPHGLASMLIVIHNWTKISSLLRRLHNISWGRMVTNNNKDTHWFYFNFS